MRDFLRSMYEQEDCGLKRKEPHGSFKPTKTLSNGVNDDIDIVPPDAKKEFMMKLSALCPPFRRTTQG